MFKRKKKIKFALEMKDGVQVRNLNDLQEHFDLEKAVGYFLDGRLLTWLKDRYYDEEAEALENLSKDDAQLKKKLCQILGVEYEDEELDPEEIEWRNERIAKLKQYTDNQEIIDNVDLVAFNQEDLADLLDDEEPVIYLCQNKFTIPLREENKKYIGIGKVEAVIKSKTIVDFAKLNIEFVNVSFDADYAKLVNSKKSTLPTIKKNEAQDDTNSILLQEAKKAEDERDFDGAIALYKRNGSAEALYRIGMIYNNKAYDKYDRQKAIEYFKQAADAGNEEAEDIVSFISEMTDSQNDMIQSDDSYDEDDDEEDDDYRRYVFEKIFEDVKSIIVEQLGVEADEVNIDSTVDDLGIDSLDGVELIMAFEEKFVIEIPDEVAEKIVTVRDVVIYIANYLESN